MTVAFRQIFRSQILYMRSKMRSGLAAFLAVTLGLALGPPLSLPAHAQDADLASLLQRIERLQRDMNTLQRYVFKGGAAPAAGTVAGAVAETTGEAPGMTRTAAARIDLRLSQFEAQLRTFLAFDARHADLERALARAVAAHATPVGSGTVART